MEKFEPSACPFAIQKSNAPSTYILSRLGIIFVDMLCVMTSLLSVQVISCRLFEETRTKGEMELGSASKDKYYYGL